MTGEPSWFEIGVRDAERGRAFYGALLGWRFEPVPGSDFPMIVTPTVAGGLHGGDPGATAMTFFAVSDLDAALERVRALGGGVDPLEEAEEATATFGRFAICRDDQGSMFGLRQPPPVTPPGDLAASA